MPTTNPTLKSANPLVNGATFTGTGSLTVCKLGPNAQPASAANGKNCPGKAAILAAFNAILAALGTNGQAQLNQAGTGFAMRTPAWCMLAAWYVAACGGAVNTGKNTYTNAQLWPGNGTQQPQNGVLPLMAAGGKQGRLTAHLNWLMPQAVALGQRQAANANQGPAQA